MKIAITGANGFVGRYVVQAALAAGDAVTVLGRTPPPPKAFSAPVGYLPYALGDTPDLGGVDALVHCGFSHVPGRYRGGEGDDPAGFTRLNLDGSVTLFDAAKSAGVARAVFLSSRAVYGDYPAGTTLSEALPPRPDTLYGQVKWQAEQALAALCGPGFTTASLRATGVYGPAGPGRPHKWAALFDSFLSGQPIAPRAGTEVHGADLAQAIRLLLTTPADQLRNPAFNASDILLDRHDLLAEVARHKNVPHPLPDRSDACPNQMTCAPLHHLGWAPGGWTALQETLPQLLNR